MFDLVSAKTWSTTPPLRPQYRQTLYFTDGKLFSEINADSRPPYHQTLDFMDATVRYLAVLYY